MVFRKKLKVEEWDWPPGRPVGGNRFVEAEPRGTGWASPTSTKIVNGYVRVVLFLLKIFLGAVGGLVLLGCAWFIYTLLNLR
jgi:hypothetical protein